MNKVNMIILIAAMGNTHIPTYIHSEISMACNIVSYYTVTAPLPMHGNCYHKSWDAHTFSGSSQIQIGSINQVKTVGLICPSNAEATVSCSTLEGTMCVL